MLAVLAAETAEAAVGQVRAEPPPSQAHWAAAGNAGRPGAGGGPADRQGDRDRAACHQILRLRRIVRKSELPAVHRAVATTMPITAARIAPGTPSTPHALTSAQAVRPHPAPQMKMPRMLPSMEPR